MPAFHKKFEKKNKCQKIQPYGTTVFARHTTVVVQDDQICKTNRLVEILLLHFVSFQVIFGNPAYWMMESRSV